MTMSQNSNKVLMAMSGGVDSSVSALVLRDEGYQVEGVTMKLFDNDDAFIEDEQTCCSTRDVEDARQVCLELGIPHFVYNFTGAFETEVIDRFCNSYLSGQTPNPCIDCNRYIKFGSLQKRRKELGYDYVATGHYVRRVFNEKTGRFEIRCGKDANKDQSYVLFHLDQETLAHMLFPLGNLSKMEVRHLAEEHGFINASKAESQDICFVPDGDYATFIGKRTGRAFEEGDIVNREGTVLGKHNGLIHYTIGQRKGIGVAAPEPLYVFKKDVSANQLVVDTDANTLCSSIEVNDVNFISRAQLDRPEHLLVKTHYRQTARPAIVEQVNESTISITFDSPQRACAPGQAAVVYDVDTVVCGGTIL